VSASERAHAILPDLNGRLALRPAEAARALGISERTFRALLPRIPHIRLDGAVLIPLDVLRRWLTERAEASGTRADRIVSEILADSATKRDNR